MLKNVIDDIESGIKPTEGQLKQLLDTNPDNWIYIFRRADTVRKKYMGDEIHIRAIIEFSSYCRRHCAYCGLNALNASAERYRMTPTEIIETAIEGWEAGYKTVVLQSGEDSWYTPQILGDIVYEIRSNTGMRVTLSCGEMPTEDYKYLRECGANRYLLKHETASSEIYSGLHPCGTLANRVRCLRDLKRLGYETGSGFMIGLPGQTTQTIAEDIMLINSIPCDMAGIGPFIPCEGTPLQSCPPGSALLTKKAVALTRLTVKNIHLPATTALGVLDAQEKIDIFSCGANVVMRKITPPKYRDLYKIYPADFGSPKSIAAERRELEEYIRGIGRIPV